MNAIYNKFNNISISIIEYKINNKFNNKISIKPNWLIVENATILLRSFCTKPEEAATKAVVEPIKVRINNAVGLYSKIGELLNNK